MEKYLRDSSKYKNVAEDAARIVSAIQIIMAMNQ